MPMSTPTCDVCGGSGQVEAPMMAYPMGDPHFIDFDSNVWEELKGLVENLDLKGLVENLDLKVQVAEVRPKGERISTTPPQEWVLPDDCFYLW